jgi:hypothetical protein
MFKAPTARPCSLADLIQPLPVCVRPGQFSARRKYRGGKIYRSSSSWSARGALWFAATPVIKISTRSDLSQRRHDLIDVDAGTIATGKASVQDVGWQIFKFILEIAGGRKKTCSDQWGIYSSLALFIPGPVT